MRILKFIFPLFLFLVIIFLLFKGLNQNPHLIPSPLIGKPVPKFSAETLENSGKFITNDTLKGKVVLLNVFASWCMACRAEHPVLMDIYDTHRVTIYGLNYKDNRAAVKNMLKKYGNPYQKIIYDPSGNIAINFGVYGTPETFIIDKHGIIRYKYIGAISPDQWKQTILPEVKKLQKGS